MSTSGIYSFAVSRDDVIRQAMLNIKRLDPDESPTAQETTDCARVLNMMCKQWMGKKDFAPGLKTWTRKRGTMFLSGTTGRYTIGPTATGWAVDPSITTSTAAAAGGASAIVVASATGFAGTYAVGVELSNNTMFWTTVSSVVGTTINLSTPLPSDMSSGALVASYAAAAQNPVDLESAFLRDTDMSDTPLTIMQQLTYDALPNKADPTNIGDPTAIYWERGLTTSQVYTDVGAAQDVAKYIIITYLEPTQDFVSSTDNPYYPQEWYLALCWGLSEQICPMFKANWDQKMEQLKNNAIAIARQGQPQISELYFQPGNDQ